MKKSHGRVSEATQAQCSPRFSGLLSCGVIAPLCGRLPGALGMVGTTDLEVLGHPPFCLHHLRRKMHPELSYGSDALHPVISHRR